MLVGSAHSLPSENVTYPKLRSLCASGGRNDRRTVASPPLDAQGGTWLSVLHTVSSLG